MNTIIQAVQEKVDALSKQCEVLLQTLSAFGWKDDRPGRTKAKMESDMPTIWRETPAKVKIPRSFTELYHQWYAGCLALVEANMPSRHKEIVTAHDEVLDLIGRDYISFDDQTAMAGLITQIKAIVSSIPHYVDARLHDIEIEVAQAYVRDQLTEAEILLKAGHVRAAGAVAGVLLERHLKLLCDRHLPPIKYTKASGIAKLNDSLKDAAVYDVPQWRKVQWMGDVRNSCDHASTAEPKKSDVADLIAEVRKFVALFVI